MSQHRTPEPITVAEELADLARNSADMAMRLSDQGIAPSSAEAAAAQVYATLAVAERIRELTAIISAVVQDYRAELAAVADPSGDGYGVAGPR